MADQYGINMNNVLNAHRAGEKRRDEREAKNAARTRNALLANLRLGATNGDQNSMQSLMVIAPDEAQQLMTVMEKMDEKQKAKLQQATESMGRIAASILTSENPSEAYNQFRESMPDMAKDMPTEYNESYVQLQLARARELDDILQNPSKITFGQNDELWKDGQRVDSTTSQNALNQQAKANEPFQPASADENAMYRQSVELFGGLFDAQGNIQSLDPELRTRAQEVARLASRMFMDGGGQMTRSEAVSQAYQQVTGRSPAPAGGGGQNSLRTPPESAINYLRRNPTRQNLQYFQEYYGIDGRQFMN